MTAPTGEERPQIILAYLLGMVIKHVSIALGLILCGGAPAQVKEYLDEGRRLYMTAEDYYDQKKGEIRPGG